MSFPLRFQIDPRFTLSENLIRAWCHGHSITGRKADELHCSSRASLLFGLLETHLAKKTNEDVPDNVLVLYCEGEPLVEMKP